MKSILKRVKLILKTHPWFTPYYNWLQWHLRGRKYSQRKVSPCYQQFYDELADLALNDSPSDILEFGCGDAYLLRKIHAKGTTARLYGSDFSRTQIKVASSLLPEAKFEFQDITATTYKDKAFDVAIGVSVLMYLNPAQLAVALKEIRRISRRFILAEFSCRYFSEEQARLFHEAQDGRYDYDYKNECSKAGFTNIMAYRCEQFWNPEINTLGEMGHSLIIAESE